MLRLLPTIAALSIITSSSHARAEEPPPRYGPDASEARAQAPIADTLAPGILMVGVGGLMGVNALVFGTSMHTEGNAPLWVGLSGIGLMATGIPLIVIGSVETPRERSAVSVSVGPGSLSLAGHF